MSYPRIAIAHDYLTQRGGAEKVVLALSRAFPDAPIFTTLFDPSGTYPEFNDLDIRTSRLNRLGIFRRNHRMALPFLPVASSRLKIDAEIVIVSSSGWAHGFRTSGRKLVYCYSPARWLYEPERYLGGQPSRLVVRVLRLLTPLLKRWDKAAARTADEYLAISTVTQGRIKRSYDIDAAIVPAPHSLDVNNLPVSVDRTRLPRPGYYLVVSRLLPYKNIRPIVEAFANRPGDRLLIVGSGPQKDELVGISGDNVSFAEALSEAEMNTVYRDCAALLAASHEDFGLTPLEAAAFGKPSVVLRWGGFLDTVVDGVTGVFFDAADPGLIAEAIDRVAERHWSPEALRDRARQYDEASFISSIRSAVDRVLASTAANEGKSR